MDRNDTFKLTENKCTEAETVSEDSESSSQSNFTDGSSETTKINSILFIEPFYGGSHKQLLDVLDCHLKRNASIKTTLFKLPAKKWHWRARTSALYFYTAIPRNGNYKTLFCSSVLNLAELIALRPDLAALYKIIYFHENQLVYPVQKEKDRDFQYGYNQILSTLVADKVVFNSYYNMNSFVENIDKFLKLQPDFVIRNLADKIKPKCRVIYFPVEVPILENKRGNILHIIWPHRWEHDKNPELFFDTLKQLKQNNIPFLLSVLGEEFSKVPKVFQDIKNLLQNEIIQFGRVDSKDEYYALLRTGHVVVSTANHEFFGVAMLEAVLSGCFPITCNRLVYPELYPPECLYNTPNQLYKKLKNLCENPHLAAVNPLLEGISKVKDLIQELEESFWESNNISNKMILKFVLLRAENQNLVHKIDMKVSHTAKCLKESEKFCRENKLNRKNHGGDREIKQTDFLEENVEKLRLYDSVQEIDTLHNTIGDLQKKLRDRETKIETLCLKYMYLKTNKKKMENELKSRIMSLEEQLNVTYDTLNEFQYETEADIEENLTSAVDLHEALFLQEKLRCSKLMYEKIRLNHKILTLEDLVRRQSIVFSRELESKFCRVATPKVDKSTSEPLMKY
ncbi:hypothetical protein RUM44_004899 [Polyplax serrata]|uniref:tRNA-queuosine alpha-mannosyltransferase n=1 Tax=Polyplax serrata TaxID=468196 RepID=A0ABR1B4L5_POLSC